MAAEAPGKPVSFDYINNPLAGGTEPDSKKPGSGPAKGTGKRGNHYGNMGANTGTGTVGGGVEGDPSQKKPEKLSSARWPGKVSGSGGRNTT